MRILKRNNHYMNGIYIILEEKYCLVNFVHHITLSLSERMKRMSAEIQVQQLLKDLLSIQIKLDELQGRW